MTTDRTLLGKAEESIDETGVQHRASDPGSPVEGQKWINTSENVLKVRSSGVDVLKSFDSVSSVNSTSPLANSDKYVLADASSGNITLTLPPVTANKVITIVKVDSSSNLVTVDGDGSETINGLLTQDLDTQNHFFTLVGTGSEWVIAGQIEVTGGGGGTGPFVLPFLAGETKAISGPRGVYLKNKKVLNIVAGSNEIRFLEGATPYIVTIPPGQYLFGDEASLKTTLDTLMNAAGGDTNYSWTVDQDNILVENTNAVNFTLDKTHPQDLLATLGFVSVNTSTPATSFEADQERDWDNDLFAFLTDTAQPETYQYSIGHVADANFTKFDTINVQLQGLLTGFSGLSLTDKDVFLSGADGQIGTTGPLLIGKVYSEDSIVLDPHDKGFIFDYEPDTDAYTPPVTPTTEVPFSWANSADTSYWQMKSDPDNSNVVVAVGIPVSGVAVQAEVLTSIDNGNSWVTATLPGAAPNLTSLGAVVEVDNLAVANTNPAATSFDLAVKNGVVALAFQEGGEDRIEIHSGTINLGTGALTLAFDAYWGAPGQFFQGEVKLEWLEDAFFLSGFATSPSNGLHVGKSITGTSFSFNNTTAGNFNGIFQLSRRVSGDLLYVTKSSTNEVFIGSSNLTSWTSFATGMPGEILVANDAAANLGNIQNYYSTNNSTTFEVHWINNSTQTTANNSAASPFNNLAHVRLEYSYLGSPITRAWSRYAKSKILTIDLVNGYKEYLAMPARDAGETIDMSIIKVDSGNFTVNDYDGTDEPLFNIGGADPSFVTRAYNTAMARTATADYVIAKLAGSAPGALTTGKIYAWPLIDADPTTHTVPVSLGTAIDIDGSVDVSTGFAGFPLVLQPDQNTAYVAFEATNSNGFEGVFVNQLP